MDVADDIERTAVVLPVVPERLPLDGRSLDRLERVENEDVTKSFAFELAHRRAELLHLLADDVRAERAVCANLVSLAADLLIDVEHDRDGQRVELARERNERLARFDLHVGRIDHREQATRETLLRNEVENVEGVVRRRLVVLVVGDEAAARVGRKDLRRFEVLACERRLARARRTDEHDERQLGNRERLRHVASARSKMAICVGAPVTGSSVPMPRKRTA